VVITIWIELARPYSAENVFVWIEVSWMESGLGVKFKTPGRMSLVTSMPSTTNILPTLPRPLALASTCVSVEKLSAAEPGLPPPTSPSPVTPGATVVRASKFRPCSGKFVSS
jgi:hypothetical protein